MKDLFKFVYFYGPDDDDDDDDDDDIDTSDTGLTDSDMGCDGADGNYY